MGSLVDRLCKKGLINPPGFLAMNVHYEVIMGSIAYGVSSDNSDMDIYGFAIPPKYMIFPHLIGEISGFGKQTNRFEQYQQAHIECKDERKEYDLQIYSIVKYFQLCMDNNPNMIDSLFVPQRCVLHSTAIGNLVRENRRMFLHKGCWHKFKGYAYSQMHKMDTKKPEGKRKEIVEKFGYDVKFAYHVVRLLNEVEMILTEGDLDVTRNREQLKSIRRGEWTETQIFEYFTMKEKSLEEVYAKSTLPYGPDENKIKELLLNCLEQHYGSLDEAIAKPNSYSELVNDLESLVGKHRKRVL